MGIIVCMGGDMEAGADCHGGVGSLGLLVFNQGTGRVQMSYGTLTCSGFPSLYL